MGMVFKDYVMKWCKDEGMFREELKEPGTEFHYRISLPELPGKNPLLMSIVQPEGKDKIIVTAAIGLDKDSSAAMAKMDLEDRERLILSLCYMLHLGPTLFNIDESEGVIRQVSVTEVIYTDGLSKDRFMKATQTVYKGISLAVLELRGIYGGTGPQKKAATPEPPARVTLGSKRP